jgi:hypothetical protein
MAPRRQRQERQERKRKPARRSWWTELERQAEEAHLRGHRQWGLLRFLARLGHGPNVTRNIMRGRRALAKLLGLDVGKAVKDDGLVHDLDGRNTRRRLARLQQLGLIFVVQPVCVKAGRIVTARGGRMPGCHDGRLRGRALRIYPGSRIYPSALLQRQIEVDNLADAGLVEWVAVGTPVDQLEPDEVLQLLELGQEALSCRGP